MMQFTMMERKMIEDTINIPYIIICVIVNYISNFPIYGCVSVTTMKLKHREKTNKVPLLLTISIDNLIKLLSLFNDY